MTIPCDSGFKDDSSVAFSDESYYSGQMSTANKTKSWNCFTSKRQSIKLKEQHEANGNSERPRKANFLQRATKKIFGKTKRIFGRKPEDGKKATFFKPEVNLKENYTEPVNIILPAESYTSVNEEPMYDDKVNFTRADQMRCSFRESRGLDPREAARVRERQTMLRVLFDFQACDDDDISVMRGELVRVLNKDDNDWWWVENVHREQGFVPRNFLWPCGCYVCQKFILEKVSNAGPAFHDQYMEQERNQSIRRYAEEEFSSFDERTKLVGNRRYTSTWC